MPWPISEWLTITVTDSSAAIRTNAFGAKKPVLAGALETECPASSGTYAAIHNPLPITADVFRNSRRGIGDDFGGKRGEVCEVPSTKEMGTPEKFFMTPSFPRRFRRRDGWRA